LPQTSGAILTTFPGLSPILAARYLAAIGDPARFQTAAQIWAFAGLDPNQADSGNRRHSGPISQRGAPQLRNTLYQLGFLATLHCPDCARLYHQVRQRGKPRPIAILHVAHKVNRILWRFLQTQQPYRSPLSPAEEAYWQAQMQQRRQKKKKRPTHS
jgi:transposase